jgi:hypothetical protein
MQDSNLIRSLQYLEDTGRNMLTEVRSRSRNLSTHDGEFDSWWKFYKELTPHLIGYAAQQNNEHINELVNKYQQHMTSLDNSLPDVAHTSLLGFISKWLGSGNSLSHQEQVQLLEDISNNVGNLLYQVKINVE